MAHEIETLNGKVSMCYAGQTPWHGLGTRVEDDLTPHQMLVAAGLDWQVVPRQLYYDVGGKRQKVPHRALVRDVDGKALTVVTKDWHPVQNEDAFAFFDDLVKLGNLKMHTAGSLLGGKRVWALAKVEDEFDLRVNGKVTRDKVEGFLLLTNPHEYGRSLDARFTTVRVVCNNTHCMAMGPGRSSNAVALNHRTEFDVERLKTLLGVAHLSMDRYKEQAELLAKVRYTEDSLKELMAKVFPHCNAQEAKDGKLSKNAEQAIQIVEQQPGAEFAPGTLWNAYNATTFMLDHVIGRSNDSRMASSWYGHNRVKKDRALDLAVKLAA